MRKSILVWALLSVIGGGIVVLLLGWLVFVAALWRRRHQVRQHAGGANGLVVTFTLGLGMGLVVASVAGDYPYWWVIGVGVLLASQLLTAYLARS